MVDVGAKRPTRRAATAEAVVRLGPQVAAALRAGTRSAKGPVLETAELAGVMAAKRAAELIPLCHPLPLDSVNVEARREGDAIRLTARVRCRASTGVEMEALTAVAVAALTVYDMCKAAGKGIVIENLRLLEKTGGKSGSWRASDRSGSRKEAK